MAIKCNVCRHARVRDADNAIHSGASGPAVARMLGDVSEDSVARHRRGGHVVPPSYRPVSSRVGVAPAPSAPAGDDDSAVAQMRRVVAAYRSIDVTRLAPAATTSHLDGYRRALESLAKLEPPPDRATVTMDEVTGMSEFVAVLFEELEPHSDIRARIRDRIRDIDFGDAEQE